MTADIRNGRIGFVRQTGFEPIECNRYLSEILCYSMREEQTYRLAERRYTMGLMDDLKGKVNEILDKTDIDEKIVEGVSELKDKAKGFLDKTDVDEKIAAGVSGLKEKAEGLLNTAEDVKDEAVQAAEEVKDEVVQTAEEVKDEAVQAAEEIKDEAAQKVDELI